MATRVRKTVTKKASAPKRQARTITEEHKRAIVAGRAEVAAIRRYMETVESVGRRTNPETLRRRLDAVVAQIADTVDPLKRVELLEQRRRLTTRLAETETVPDVAELEAGFVLAAGRYSQRKGITYDTWREAGVPARILRQAGLTR